MYKNLSFLLEGNVYTCEVEVDNTQYPCLVFVKLNELELIDQFGEEVTVKTDFDHLLPRNDDYPALTSLRQSILDALQFLPEWMAERIHRKPVLPTGTTFKRKWI